MRLPTDCPLIAQVHKFSEFIAWLTAIKPPFPTNIHAETLYTYTYYSQPFWLPII